MVDALDLAAAAAVLAGAGLQSAVGFGFSLVCAPLVLAAFGPEQAVGLLIVLGLEVNLVSLVGEGRRPRPLGRLVLVVLAWALPGMVVGVAVLRSADAVVLQAALVAVVAVSLVLRRVEATQSAPRSPAWTPLAGAAAGVLTTTTSTAGPPLVLLLLGRGIEPARVRDTLTAAFIGLSLAGGAVLAITGTDGAVPDAVALAAFVPLAALGQLAGRPLFARLAAGRYERVLTVVLVCSALLGLATAIA